MSSFNGTSTANAYDLPSLRRWSSAAGSQLPAQDNIRAIHVYDFDNTLFRTPLPNRQLWDSRASGKLMEQEAFANGGWWHDSSILAATGGGVEKEEPQAWQGWWNESVVELVRLSMEDEHTLSVLLTGRGEVNFAELIRRMTSSKNLSFDLFCLKPASSPATSQPFGSTLLYKQALLSQIIYTYPEAEEIRVYEDRPKHIRAFRDFFTQFNTSLDARAKQTLSSLEPKRRRIYAEVIEVSEESSNLDPTTEVAAVQRMINLHNIAFKSKSTSLRSNMPYRIARDVLFTAYLIDKDGQTQLQKLVSGPSFKQKETNDVRYLANAIMISPYAKSTAPTILTRIGGIGHTVEWRVTDSACSERNIWAARVTPVNPKEQVVTEPQNSLVVLALRKGSRPSDAARIRNWQPIHPQNQFTFKATVGEKVLLRIEEETGPGVHRKQTRGRRGQGGVFLTAADSQRSPPNKKIHVRDQDFIPLGDTDDKAGNGYGFAQDENRHPQYGMGGISVGNKGPSGNHHGQGRSGGRGNAKLHDRPPLPRNDRPGGGGGGGRNGNSGNFGGRAGRSGRGRGGYKSLDDVDGAGRGYKDHDAAYGKGAAAGGELRYDY